VIIDYDKALETLVQTISPNWTELRLQQSRFSKLDEQSFASLSVMLVGTGSLLCSMDAKTVPGTIWEYYPIHLEKVDERAYDPSEWVTLLRANGESELEKKTHWLFEKPSLRLLVSEEELAEGAEPNARKHLLKFYSGVEFTDPTHTKLLQVCSCADPLEFVVNARFVF
jgi:hypothetical protein